MAKKKKHIAPLRTDKSLVRKQGKKQPRPLILIVCEGETEKLYFEAMRKELRFSSIEIHVPYRTEGSAPINVVAFAEKKCKESYEHAYCVFDRDNHESFNRARERIRTLSTRKRNPLPLKEAISVVCFEIWILMHFTKTDKQYNNSDEIIRHLKEKGYIPDYNKTHPQLFEKIKSRQNTAIENAKWLESVAKDNEYNRSPKPIQIYPKLSKSAHNLS